MNETTESLDRFRDYFQLATGVQPYPYQERLALAPAGEFPEVLNASTGVGKTAAAELGWLFRRRFHPDKTIRQATPRRLVYCLPMRVLVEQTNGNTCGWLKKLGLLAARPGDNAPADGWAAANGGDQTRIAVHLLMGGEETTDWALWPERDAILIGTQDMLLSRALNRGYAIGRARWPLEFALLNNDCLWVFDEVQLMSTGLATSLQLDAWRKSLALRGDDGFQHPSHNTAARPCRSLWMSATMAKHWLETAVDWKPYIAAAWPRMLEEHQHFRANDCGANGPLSPLFAGGTKPVKGDAIAELKAKRGERPDVPAYLDDLAQRILNFLNQGSLKGVALVIMNTVDRACGLYERFKRAKAGESPALPGIDVHLIHSRFRPQERENWRAILDKANASPRLIVSTQVIEAGVDLSAKVLFTELAPWPSLVQRFGRCARYVDPTTNRAEFGEIYWMDTLAEPLPYDQNELVEARNHLKDLPDAGLAGLQTAADGLDESAQRKLFPYEPRFVPREKDLFDLFDTTPDLTGADIDISRFIRDGDELDVQVFWQDVPGAKPWKKLRPCRQELCPVPFLQFRDFLKKLPSNRRIWRWNYVLGDWERVTRDRAEVVFPGQVFLLETACGGYDTALGWTGDPSDTHFEPVRVAFPDADDRAPADEDDGSDELSVVEKWLNVEQHTRDVCCKLDELLADATQLAAGLTPSERKILRVAARWHDRGKAHEAFKAKLDIEVLEKLSDDVRAKLGGEPIEVVAIAKAPDLAWLRRPIRRSGETSRVGDSEPDDEPGRNADKRRPKFRHELASALAILETLRSVKPGHEALAWPAGLDPSDFPGTFVDASVTSAPEPRDDSPLFNELTELSPDELDLLVYLVAAHHGKVRMSLRSVPEDSSTNQPAPCPADKRRARGVQDDDETSACRLPGSGDNTSWLAPKVSLHLDPMELGLSPRYGASWRERTQKLLESLGPFRLAYLESLLRIADCRASAEEGVAAQDAATREKSK